MGAGLLLRIGYHVLGLTFAKKRDTPNGRITMNWMITITMIFTTLLDGFMKPRLGSETKPKQMQLTLFGSPHEETIDEIKKLAVDDLTPLEALMKLQEIRAKILEKEK